MTLSKFHRLDLGLTAREVASLAGLSQPEVTLIENGRLRPTPKQLTKLATALGIAPPEALLFKKTARDFGAEVKVDEQAVPA